MARASRASLPSTGLEFNVVGRADAPVTIIEFSDLQCPYCARNALNTFPEIKRNYIDTGKVRYVARDFPLDMHPFAMPAAVATRCAGEQGKFWEYRHALFERQNELATAPYDALAAELGLDVPRFAACQKDRRTGGRGARRRASWPDRTASRRRRRSWSAGS